MNKSDWKSAEEIEFTLQDFQKITIFSCGVCANLSGTGGHRGMKFLRKLLQGWGKEVVAAECITACCAEEIMRQAVRIHGKHISESDVLVVISCAAGVKSAFLCHPGLPVVAVTDSVGSVPVSRKRDPVARSMCTNCGHCVITYTGGICPLSECPSHRKYEPCAQHVPGDVRCAVDPPRECIWRYIEEKGDPHALKELSLIHGSGGAERLSLPLRRPSPALVRELSGWMVARARWFGRLVHLVN